MKVTWEERDIRAGRRVLAWNASEEWIIGYAIPVETDKTWHLISLSDGMISGRHSTKQELVDHLNEGGNLPIELERPWEKL